MDLKNKRTRRRAIAFAATTAVIGAGVTAVNAFASGTTLAFGPTPVAATMTNLSPIAGAVPAATAYGFKITGAPSGDTDPLRISVLTGPSSNSTSYGLWAERISANGAPVTNPTGTQLADATPTLITGSGTAGSTTLTLSLGNATSVTGKVLRIGGSSGSGGQFAVASAGGTTTTITLDRPLTATVASVAVYDLGTSSAATAFLYTATGSSNAVPGYSTSGADNVYIGATYPGTYTFQLYKDRNGNGAYDSAQDDTTPTFTLTVKDVNNTTSSDSTDDLVPTVTVPSTLGIGQAITASVATGLTMTDTRGLSGGSPSVGVLGNAFAAASNLAFTAGGTGIGTGGAPAFDGTSLYRTSANSNAAGTATSTYTIGSAISVPATTTVAGNNVTAVDLAPVASATEATTTTAVTPTATGTAAASTITTSTNSTSGLNGHRLKISKTGENTEYVVVASGAGTTTLTLASPLVYSHSAGSTIADVSGVAVKTGTAAATYTATVLDNDTDKSGNLVYFTLGGTDVASLTTSGTTVDSTNHVFSAATNSSGVATLTVTDGASTRVAYTIAGASNGVSGGTLTATYADAAATTLTITSGTAALSPVAGTASVPISGKLTDQYGAMFQPPVSASQQVTVSNAVTGFTTLSGGTFTYTYTPSSAPAAGTSQTIGFTYAVGSNPTANAVVNWASAVAPANVAISAPASTATPAVALYSAVPTGTTITGSVTDSGNAGLAYKTVTLTGDPGVYFSTSSSGTDLATTLAVATNSSGTFTAYAFFTKTGAAKITATSATKSASVSPVVADALSSEGYKVIAVDKAGTAGSTLVVAGKVADVFGNGVSGATVTLSANTSSLGVLGASSVTTSANGDFSTTFVSGASEGTVTITAKINGGTNRKAATGWSTIAGLTLADGASTDTATLTIGSGTPTITGPSSHAAGAITLSGTAPSGASVDIYAKAAGSSAGLVWIGTAMADVTTGDWSKVVVLSGHTTFVAKAGSMTSTELTVHVTGAEKGSVVCSAKAMGKGLVKVVAMGKPAKTGTFTLYVKAGSKWVKVRSWTSTSSGAGSVMVKTGKGSKTFLVSFTPAGGTAGSSTVVVKVK